MTERSENVTEVWVLKLSPRTSAHFPRKQVRVFPCCLKAHVCLLLFFLFWMEVMGRRGKVFIKAKAGTVSKKVANVHCCLL